MNLVLSECGVGPSEAKVSAVINARELIVYLRYVAFWIKVSIMQDLYLI